MIKNLTFQVIAYRLLQFLILIVLSSSAYCKVCILKEYMHNPAGYLQ